jgi:hypothetical protein
LVYNRRPTQKRAHNVAEGLLNAPVSICRYALQDEANWSKIPHHFEMCWYNISKQTDFIEVRGTCL